MTGKLFTLNNVVIYVIIPLVGVCGMRILNSLDNLDQSVQEIKIQQAVDHQQLQDMRVYLRLSSKPIPNDQ
jgi:hypothetical protein